jgi:4-amino-4-deoxy-L-arabinose transferase-like glycosyltransferase
MDFPPAIALLSEAVRATLGESLPAIRLVPALAGTALLVLAALIARELGGGRRAQAIAALGVLASPLFLRSANLFQPVVLDQLAWTAALYALVRLCRDASRRWWILLGAARRGHGSPRRWRSRSAAPASWASCGSTFRCSPRWPISAPRSSGG